MQLISNTVVCGVLLMQRRVLPTDMKGELLDPHVSTVRKLLQHELGLIQRGEQRDSRRLSPLPSKGALATSRCCTRFASDLSPHHETTLYVEFLLFLSSLPYTSRSWYSSFLRGSYSRGQLLWWGLFRSALRECSLGCRFRELPPQRHCLNSLLKRRQRSFFVVKNSPDTRSVVLVSHVPQVMIAKEAHLSRPHDHILEVAKSALQKHLGMCFVTGQSAVGIHFSTIWTAVVVHQNCIPQYTVGHNKRVCFACAKAEIPGQDDAAQILFVRRFGRAPPDLALTPRRA